MKLDVCGRRTIQNPSDAEIRDALRGLDAGDESGFVILGPDVMTYIQTCGDERGGFELEYQEGSTERHYCASDSAIPLDEILRAFREYRDGCGDWKERFQFERITW